MTARTTQNEVICTRLGDEAEAHGVQRQRIVFGKRVPKSEHLLRHAAADLFLDTLIYGAHSTATDALAGGLPFLTLAGVFERAYEMSRGLGVGHHNDISDIWADFGSDM